MRYPPRIRRAPFSLLLLLIATAAAGQPRQDRLCEESPLDIFPDVFFHCEAMQSFRKGFDAHALELMQRASLWGSKPAQYKVGLMIAGGFGTDMDPVEGAAWLLLANERNPRRMTPQLEDLLAALEPAQVADAWARARELRETYGDLAALERRGRWVRRMKGRTTGSRLGKPMAGVRIVGSQGITGDQAIARLERYEESLREVIGTVEYRDFQVIEPEHEGDERP